MKKSDILFLLKSLLVIFIISQILDKTIYYLLRHIERNVYTGQAVGKINQFITIKDSMDLVVFGNSRANHNVDCKLISHNSYNMGIDGTKILYSNSLIQLLGDKKQTILLQVDPADIFDATYEGEDLDKLLIKYNSNEVIKKEIDRYNRNNPLQNLYWCISFNNKVIPILSNYFNKGSELQDYYGYDPIVVSDDQRKIFQNLLSNFTAKKKSCDVETRNQIMIKALKELDTFCKQHNKELILFTAPVYFDECDEDNKILSQKLSELNIRYFDYSNLFAQDNNIEYWKDFTHLSGIGAEKFTHLLINDLQTGQQ